MKKLLALMAVLSVVVVVVFIRCNSNNGFVTQTGTPGLVQGTLFDVNGNPVVGGTMWLKTPNGVPLTVGSQLFLTDNGVTCPDVPGSESFDDEGCTGAQGGFSLDCSADEDGTVTLDAQDSAGQRLGNGDLDGDGEEDVAIVTCGTSTNVTVDQAAATPSPTPSPSP